MFLTKLCESKLTTPVEKWAYENEEGMFLNAADKNLIGCLGCLSHSSLRNGSIPYSISHHNMDQFLCSNEIHKDLVSRTRDKTLNKLYEHLEKMHYLMWQLPQSCGQKDIVEWSDIKRLFKKLRREK